MMVVLTYYGVISNMQDFLLGKYIILVVDVEYQVVSST